VVFNEDKPIQDSSAPASPLEAPTITTPSLVASIIWFVLIHLVPLLLLLAGSYFFQKASVGSPTRADIPSLGAAKPDVAP
jgi:hypothetical protein